MKFNKLSMLIFVLITLNLSVFLLAACHLQGQPDKTADNAAAAQTSINHSRSGNQQIWRVPQTGQTRKFMTSDDGDLRYGKPWPEPRFIKNGDDTVTDNLSGLMWTRNANKANGKADWEQAILGAGNCTDGGHTNWRLPNRIELESLIDLGKFNPALPADHPFIGVQPSYYWTSTTPSNNEDHAWVIHFYIGFVTHDDKGGSHYVWYVRN
jgi:hypothetical protein